MGILNLKKRVNRDKCSFTTKQRMFGVFAIDEPGALVRALYANLIESDMDFFVNAALKVPYLPFAQK